MKNIIIKNIFIILLVLCLPVMASAAEDWLQISTQHFTFVYQKADEPSAQKLAGFAEKVYGDVTNYFQEYPNRVWAVIRSSTQEFNGYFSFEPARIDLFLAPPTQTIISAYSEDYLKNLLVHELTHYVHLTQHKGMGGLWEYILGPDSAFYNELFLPGWAIEGITTNTEGMFATGGRARNPFFEMSYKAPLLEHKMWTYDQAAYASYNPPYDRIYVSGFMMVDYLRSTWGEKAFNQIYLDYIQDPFAFFWGYNRSLERFTGKKCPEFFDEVQKFMVKKFAADAQLTPGIQLSPQGQGAWYLPYKTQRGWLGYAEPAHSAPGIYIENQGAPELLLPATLVDPYSFGVNADGQSILYATTSSTNKSVIPSAYTTQFVLWYWKNGVSKKLTEETGFYNPRLNGEGNLWYSLQIKAGEQYLVRGDLEGKTTVIYHKPGHLLQMMELSPDGKTLALAENIRGHQVLTLLDTQGRVIYRLDPGAAVYYPRWTDNDHLIFSTDKAGRLDLYLVDLGQKVYQELNKDPVGAASGFLDGDKLIYQTYTSEGWAYKRFNQVASTPTLGLPASWEEENAPGEPGLTPVVPEKFADVPTYNLAFPVFGFSTDSSSYLGYSFEGNSLLETQSWLLKLFYYPSQKTFGGVGAYTWRLDGWQAEAAVLQRSANSTNADLMNQKALFLASFPWGEWDTPQYIHRITSKSLVGFSRDFLASNPSQGWAEVQTDVATTWTLMERNLGTGQFFGGWGTSAYAEVDYTPPLLDRNIPRWDLNLAFSDSLALGPMVLKSLVRATEDTTQNLVLSTPGYIPTPLNSMGLKSDWRTDFKTSLLWPFGTLDWNVLGLAVLRQGFSLWADFGVQGFWNQTPLWDNGMTYGLEFDTYVQVGELRCPVYIGMAAQYIPGGNGFANKTLYLGVNAAAIYDGLMPQSLK